MSRTNPSEPATAASYQAVRMLAANMRGRDYVVGDIHGAFDLVDDALGAIGFDQEVDRLISVGDLIDRGKDSAQCVQFLRRPYVHAVRGNHDHDFCGLDPQIVGLLAKINFNGMAWAVGLPVDQLREIQAALYALPLAIEIESRTPGELPVGIIHADVPPGLSWPQTIALLRQVDQASLLRSHDEHPALALVLGGRSRFDEKVCEVVEGARSVFVGHCISWGGPISLGNMIYVDTGAVKAQAQGYFRGALTLLDSDIQPERVSQVASWRGREDLRVYRHSTDSQVPWRPRHIQYARIRAG